MGENKKFMNDDKYFPRCSETRADFRFNQFASNHFYHVVINLFEIYLG